MPQPTDAEYGSLAGTAAGTFFGPAGMAVGGAAGGMIGGLFDKGPGGPQYDPAWFNDRQAQINQYSASLSAARSSYLTSLGNMYQDAFTRFGNNSAPAFARDGLNINSGAFAQSLAYKSAEYEAQLTPAAYAAQREDLNSVDRANSSLFTSKINALTHGADLGYSTGNANNASAMQGLISGVSTYQSTKGRIPNPMSSYNAGNTGSLSGEGAGLQPVNRLGLAGAY